MARLFYFLLAVSAILACEITANDQVAAKTRTYGQPRNYAAPLTKQERGDIGYIVKTLSVSSPLKLLKYKHSLEEAGDRLDHVHPLRFIEAIFTDEEMKAEIRPIRKSSFIWREFFSGIKDSLNEEYTYGNLKPEFIQDFAHTLGVDYAGIQPFFKSKKWQDLMDYLIAHVARKGDTGRYDF